MRHRDPRRCRQGRYVSSHRRSNNGMELPALRAAFMLAVRASNHRGFPPGAWCSRGWTHPVRGGNRPLEVGPLTRASQAPFGVYGMRWVVAETPGHHGWKVVRGLARSHVIRSDQRAGVLRQH